MIGHRFKSSLPFFVLCNAFVAHMDQKKNYYSLRYPFIVIYILLKSCNLSLGIIRNLIINNYTLDKENSIGMSIMLSDARKLLQRCIGDLFAYLELLLNQLICKNKIILLVIVYQCIQYYLKICSIVVLRVRGYN